MLDWDDGAANSTEGFALLGPSRSSTGQSREPKSVGEPTPRVGAAFAGPIPKPKGSDVVGALLFEERDEPGDSGC